MAVGLEIQQATGGTVGRIREIATAIAATAEGQAAAETGEGSSTMLGVIRAAVGPGQPQAARSAPQRAPRGSEALERQACGSLDAGRAAPRDPLRRQCGGASGGVSPDRS
jgi:hypothetical protein